MPAFERPEQTAIVEAGAIERVEEIIARLGANRLFFVIDELAFDSSGARAVLAPVMDKYPSQRFVGFDLNPKLQDVIRGIDDFQAFEPDLVIAVGGGSALDLGKLIGSLAVQADAPVEIISGQRPLTTSSPPLVAVPTTAGTGSEATHFAVVYIDGVKYSLADPALLPQFAIVDPLLTHSMPASVTAASGLDALCQSIESIWAVGATDQSMRYATDALTLAKSHLRSATVDPNADSRMGMCRAAHLAGKAINITKTTAPHALSYPLTTQYDVPHGIAVALMLGPMFIHNSDVVDDDCADPRGSEHVRQRINTIIRLLGVQDAVDANRWIAKLLTDIGCPPSLADVGITKPEQLQQIVAGVNAERMSNNPRRISGERLVELYSS